MKSPVLSLSFIGWYLLIPPVFSPMGEHSRSFNDLSAPLNKWDIWARSIRAAVVLKRKNTWCSKRPSASNSHVNISTRMPTATSSPCQKLGNMRIASPPTIRA
jgi:hypothetical protein